VCEWGPEDGPRVLFLHGISTSCITLAKLAHGLAKRGCRVMLFDLFGRGYSDGVGDLPHDARLYVSQALMAMASSPVSWTGHGTLRVIGYSMGAGISIHLAAAFPELVSSLVLIAPAGLIRPANFGFSRHLFRSGIVPERLLATLTRRRLQRPIASKKAIQEAQEAIAQDQNDEPAKLESPSEDILDVGIAEAADPNTTESTTAADDGDNVLVDLKSRVLGFVQWMVVHHEGFLSAFMSSVRYAPLAEQEDSWRAIAKRPKGTTSVILGSHDEIIHIAQFEEDAPPLIGGKDHVRWTVLPGAHDIPMTHSKEILADIDEFWRLQYE
jgi:pimeloyl-ACP methyl ester carboxylesterase